MKQLLVYTERIRFTRLAQAVCGLLFSVVVLTMICYPRYAEAANIDLTIKRNGSVVDQKTGQLVGEVYHGWRQDIIFSSLTRAAGETGQQFTVSVSSADYIIDDINPQLYAVHGGKSRLVRSSTDGRTWSVSAPPGSLVTVVSEIPNGLLHEGLGWRLLSWMGNISDGGWFTLAVLLPILCIGFTIWRKQHLLKNTLPNEHLNPALLNASPAALTVLWRGFVSRRATAATLVDLARRGHIQILVRQDAIMLYRRESTDPLKEHEMRLLRRWFGVNWDSKIHLLAKQNRRELVNEQSMSVNIAVYDEIAYYGWFNPSPILSHWQILTITFFLTIIFAGSFFSIFIFLPAAASLLWFFAGCLVTVGILYACTPSYVRYTFSGIKAYSILLSTKRIFSDSAPIHAVPSSTEAWEYWLPLAMVLGVAPQWLKRWQEIPFQQPAWLLTSEPIRDFNQFLDHLTPVLKIASESIRDKILPAYL